MSGRVLAEQLLPRQPGMRVLYMSGYTDSFISGHGVLEPGTHLLHKPFTDEVLTGRPYQRAGSFESAREIIRQLSGTAFDPQVVSVFLNIREDVWPAIAKNQSRIAGLSPELRKKSSQAPPGVGLDA